MDQIKVQFCSGGSRIPGWQNRDTDCDITKPLPYANDSVEATRIEHGLEHVTTHEALHFLDEVYRILKPGGSFRLSVPVLDRLTREHGREIVFQHGHQCAFSTLLARIFLGLSGFTQIIEVERDADDHHWNMIGKERDDLETARFLAIK